MVYKPSRMTQVASLLFLGFSFQSSVIHLATVCSGKVFPEDDFIGNHVFRQGLIAVCPNFLEQFFTLRITRIQNHIGSCEIDSLFVGDTDGAAKSNSRMLQNSLLHAVREHLGHIAILSLGHDDPLNSAADKQNAILVHITQIAGMNPPMTAFYSSRFFTLCLENFLCAGIG